MLPCGKRSMVFEGYSYVRDHYSKIFTHWKCAVGCKAWMKTRTESNKFFRGDVTHSHLADVPPKAKKIQRRRASCRLSVDDPTVAENSNLNKAIDKKKIKILEPLPLINVTQKNTAVDKGINTLVSWKKLMRTNTKLTQRYPKVFKGNSPKPAAKVTTMTPKYPSTTIQKLNKTKVNVQDTVTVSGTQDPKQAQSSVVQEIESNIANSSKNQTILPTSNIELHLKSHVNQENPKKPESKEIQQQETFDEAMKKIEICQEAHSKVKNKSCLKSNIKDSKKKTISNSKTSLTSEETSQSDASLIKKVRFCVPHEDKKTYSIDTQSYDHLQDTDITQATDTKTKTQGEQSNQILEAKDTHKEALEYHREITHAVFENIKPSTKIIPEAENIGIPQDVLSVENIPLPSMPFAGNFSYPPTTKEKPKY